MNHIHAGAGKPARVFTAPVRPGTDLRCRTRRRRGIPISAERCRVQTPRAEPQLEPEREELVRDEAAVA